VIATTFKKERVIIELEAPPPNLRDLPRRCHPRWARQNRRGG
jgi:hypothetical protein